MYDRWRQTGGYLDNACSAQIGAGAAIQLVSAVLLLVWKPHDAFFAVLSVHDRPGSQSLLCGGREDDLEYHR